MKQVGISEKPEDSKDFHFKFIMILFLKNIQVLKTFGNSIFVDIFKWILEVSIILAS